MTDKTLKDEYREFAKQTLNDLLVTIGQKNADYSHGDSPFANFEKSTEIGIQPLAGLFLRMQDKNSRVAAYLQRGDLSVPGEGIEDAFLDIIGYSLLALGMLKFGHAEGDEKCEQS